MLEDVTDGWILADQVKPGPKDRAHPDLRKAHQLSVFLKIKPPAMRVVHVFPVNLVYIHEWQLKGNKWKATAAIALIKWQPASLEGNFLEELSFIRGKISGLQSMPHVVNEAQQF